MSSYSFMYEEGELMKKLKKLGELMFGPSFISMVIAYGFTCMYGANSRYLNQLIMICFVLTIVSAFLALKDVE